MRFLSRKKAVQQLDRIYINECYIILNNQTDFRRQLQELGRLNRVEAQMVLLTATLPPSCEAEL